MQYTYDYFVAKLQCPNCGEISEADDSTNMVTRIRSNPELAYLGVGDALKIDRSTIEESGYFVIQSPLPNEEVRILETWECPSCGQSFNWAEIVVRDGIIESILPVLLTREVLEQAHFISDESAGVAAALTDRPYAELLQENVIEILKNYL